MHGLHFKNPCLRLYNTRDWKALSWAELLWKPLSRKREFHTIIRRSRGIRQRLSGWSWSIFRDGGWSTTRWCRRAYNHSTPTPGLEVKVLEKVKKERWGTRLIRSWKWKEKQASTFQKLMKEAFSNLQQKTVEIEKKRKCLGTCPSCGKLVGCMSWKIKSPSWAAMVMKHWSKRGKNNSYTTVKSVRNKECEKENIWEWNVGK